MDLSIPKRELFNSGQDMAYRLDSGFLRYKKFVYYSRVTEDEQIILYPLGLLSSTSAAIRGNWETFSADLDIDPLPLGYFNTGSQWIYLARGAHRGRQQLTSGNNTHYFCRAYPDAQNIGNSSLGIPSLQNVVDRRYPKFTDCMNRIMGNHSTLEAFHHQFCIEKFTLNHAFEIGLFFKTNQIGTWKNDHFEILPSFSSCSCHRFFDEIKIPVVAK